MKYCFSFLNKNKFYFWRRENLIASTFFFAEADTKKHLDMPWQNPRMLHW